jgi:hypothetical protein
MCEHDPDAVRVTDCGIARITDSSKPKTGLVQGTPSFISLEQIAADLRAVLALLAGAGDAWTASTVHSGPLVASDNDQATLAMMSPVAAATHPASDPFEKTIIPRLPAQRAHELGLCSPFSSRKPL